MCNALTDEHSRVRWLIFDWYPALQEFAEQCQQVIKAHKMLQQSDFLWMTFLNYGCMAIESIDEAEACAGLVQAKEKLENDQLEFVYLDDNVNAARGVSEGRVEVCSIRVDAKRVIWNLNMRYEEGSQIESPPFDIPVKHGS